MLFWILFVLIVLIALALFELGKNSLWGWALLVLLLVFWVRARTQLLSGAGFLPRLLCFLGFLALLGLLFVISGPREKAVPAVSNKKPRMTGVVRVAEGQLTGVYTADEAVEVYAGIPYAKPPLGELRWREPQPPEPWEGVRVCDTFAPMSMQPRNHPVIGSLMDIFGSHRFRLSLTDNWIEPMSEDSLYLNIWKPAGRAEKLPVLVYIHGGSLTTGQPSYSEYNGESLARKGILVVNFGYRLGVFGYYADEALAAESPNGSTGNYGLLDQIQALKWVRENIAAFGGTRITSPWRASPPAPPPSTPSACPPSARACSKGRPPPPAASPPKLPTTASGPWSGPWRPAGPSGRSSAPRIPKPSGLSPRKSW